MKNETFKIITLIYCLIPLVLLMFLAIVSSDNGEHIPGKSFIYSDENINVMELVNENREKLNNLKE